MDERISDQTQHIQLRKRPVRVLLRGNRSLEGLIHVSEGQSLTGFLGMKKYFLNLTEVKWLDTPAEGEPLPHLGIRISQIVWVVPLDGALPLSSAQSAPAGQRSVELHLVDGVTLHVTLRIAPELRMSDYFDSNAAFIPLRDARATGSSRAIDRLAVQHEAILAIRET